MSPPAPTLQRIAGFESTAYAYLHGQIAWFGSNACTLHPRNATLPWQPGPFQGDARSLVAGAQACLGLIEALPPKGLLGWLIGQALPFPLNHAQARFDAVRAALERNDLRAFEAAALRVLGLGQGLTPSGDDFVGAIFFALAHAPRAAWRTDMPALQSRIREAARCRTNVISAALLEDLMQGVSYSLLHDAVAALQGNALAQIRHALQDLMRLGASSGADMLAGLLLALTTAPVEE